MTIPLTILIVIVGVSIGFAWGAFRGRSVDDGSRNFIEDLDDYFKDLGGFK